MIYFDSAATTFQKPPEVARAMLEALRGMSSPGRGGYPLARRAAETAFACRSELATLFGAASAEQVVFTFNATHALNLAIKSLVPRRGKAVVSGYEHNAVTRPLHALEAEVTVAAGELFNAQSVLEAFARAIAPDTDAVICTHVSNVFGFIQPIEAIAKLCRERGVPLIVDASQSAGVLPLDLTALGAAFIAMPGHKGLYGPQGTGVLLVGEGRTGAPLLEGGTGSLSREQEMPPFLPDRLEAGTHNMPGIAGLLAGVRFVRARGTERIFRHERALTERAAEGLARMKSVHAYASADANAQCGVLSLWHERYEPETLGEILAAHGIAARAGLHCAPLAHESAKSPREGTLRVSFSAFNTHAEVGRFLAVMRSLEKNV
ncbi:MAG: aminotransferase class V-fold PLP-dependent enzyme [Oscillibacter sp.]|nr:aminotransferase class V-fold PLP-dependent enzyme [Oscillibacter sp.]